MKKKNMYKILKKKNKKNIFKKKRFKNIGYYQLRCLQLNYITKKNFESVRRLLSRKVKKKISFIIFKNPNKIPTFKKPLKVRMGSGGGGFNDWLWKIKKNQTIFQISTFKKKFLFKKYLKKIKKKIPYKIFITIRNF